MNLRAKILSLPFQSLSWVPAGTYEIGMRSDELITAEERGHRFYSTRERKSVSVTGFFVRTHPVSLREFALFAELRSYRPRGEDHAAFRSSSPSAPVEVSYLYAKRYAKWMGGRLPTPEEYYILATGLTGLQLPECARQIAEQFPRRRSNRIGAHPECRSIFGVQDLIGCVDEWVHCGEKHHNLAIGLPYSSNSNSENCISELRANKSAGLVNGVGFRYVVDPADTDV